MQASDGPRVLSFPAAAWRVASTAPLRLLRGKRLLGLLVLALAPVFIAFAVLVAGAERDGMRVFMNFFALFWIALIVPLATLFFAAGAVGDDLDNGTFLYQRLRPVSRGAIVVGRWAATCASALVLFLPVLCLHYLVQVGGNSMQVALDELHVLAGACATVAVATLTYSAVFLLLAVLFKRAIIIGLFFIAGWEEFASRVPSSAAFGTVSFHAQAQMSHVTSEGQVLQVFLRPFVEQGLVPSWGASVGGMLAATCVLLWLAARRFARTEVL